MAGGADGVLFVEDGGKTFRILLDDVAHDVLDYEVDVQRNQDPATEWVRVKQRRYIEEPGFQEGFDERNQLRGQGHDPRTPLDQDDV